MIEGVLIWEIRSFGDLILLGVKYVGAATGGTVFLASEDQNFVLRNRASSEPVFDVRLKTATPYFN